MINKEANNIMIIAGEVSGDLHGASLITELKRIDSTIDICGIGGDKMKAAGMQLIYHIDRMAFLGFVEVVKHIPFIKKVQRQLIDTVIQRGIKTVVLIDYPGFNLSIAKRLKELGIKIIYYISPQIWAWGAGRINKIKTLVDKMLVVFPFEEKLYKNAGIPVEYVGHPLIEQTDEKSLLGREELYKKFNLDINKEILLILSGSREHEVEKIFPEVIKAATKLAEEYNLQVVVACSSNISEKTFYRLTEIKDFTVIKDYTYDLMNFAKIGIIKSGTSTLEAALFGLPMVIVYKTTLITYLIGRNLVKLKNIGLANIVAGKTIVPELIQKHVSEETIYNECKKIISDVNLYNSIKEKLRSIKATLGSIGASKRAAESIYAIMNS
ncbi:MAG: lipid-A-disaccharide synthase [Ignavibacteriaceae bacterium]